MLSNVPSFSNRRHVHVFFSTLVFLSVLFIFWHATTLYAFPFQRYLSTHFSFHVTDLSAGNATLGFEAILVVSPNRSLGGETIWRQDGLVRAANLTGLSIDIPPQYNYTHAELESTWTATQDYNGTLEGAKSRLSHVRTLERIVAHNYTTALILENDADWDVALRSQTLAIASAIRNLTWSSSSASWGTNWDVLIPGHCSGGYINASLPYRITSDPTVRPAAAYQSPYRSPHQMLPLPEHTRLIYPPHGFTCTYGYAVSHHGAQNLLHHLSGKGGPWDLDVAHACSLYLTCYIVVPEIIHHQRWTGHHVLSGEGHGALSAGETAQKFTVNIEHSARCNSEPDVVRRKGKWIKCHPSGLSVQKYTTR